MQEVHLDKLDKYINDTLILLNSYESDCTNINNKIMNKGSNFVESIESSIIQYIEYREFYVNNEEFYHKYESFFNKGNMIFERRYKNNKSLLVKIERNIDKNMVFRKIINDIIGTRIIIETNTSIMDITIKLKELFAQRKGIRVLNSSKDTGYTAVHIYISHKTMLPIEVQIWRKKDRDSNHKSHSIHKQKHFKKENND